MPQGVRLDATSGGPPLVLVELEVGEHQGWFSWGVHDPAEFLARCSERSEWARGMKPEHVVHACVVETRTRYSTRYREVGGEPNSTALYSF